ncbi:TauD/TfdA family dioxygenase [Kibdelosporangium persicum]|uniref:L-asparagine oxygenase n=1 Tax=Kibdelosporangium persicum TaxID=2698649 RepID=A0ABX2FFH6_9PSEU|nr:TauD/TfdA family dioxygenase [Kibdelosporangium persicum]NRN69523.1 L-asparagine oxygenase [Kibdelosporangium persicum]
MSVLLDLHEEITVVTLGTEESDALAGVARRLCTRADGRVDNVGWVAAAGEAWEETPPMLRQAVRTFRRDSGRHGTLLLRGLPLGSDPLPPTPNADNSVQRTATCPAAVLMMVASGLGDPVAFMAEKSGALVQDVVPVPDKETSQSNAGSVPLMFHTENAFHAHRPDYVLLNCLRADQDGSAGLRVVSVRALLPYLDDRTREALWAEEFVTEPPPSFATRAGAEGVPHAVLHGHEDDPEIRVDLVATRPMTRRAGSALARLRDCCEAVSLSVYLSPGDLVVVDNRSALHGRSAFRARYDGYDRWLQRTFVLADLRRSRRYRSQDGHVLNSWDVAESSWRSTAPTSTRDIFTTSRSPEAEGW